MQRRVPLGDHKLLTYVSTMFAYAWEEGAATQNAALMSWASRGLLFSEQCALDQGRTQFAWLFSGLPQPDWHVLSSHRRKPHMLPYASLSKPAWAAANVAYMKELAFLESRLASADKPEKTTATTPEADGASEAPPPRRPRRAKGGATS